MTCYDKKERVLNEKTNECICNDGYRDVMN